MLQLSLDKEMQTSDWGSLTTRQLSSRQVAYAAADAAVLLPLLCVLLGPEGSASVFATYLEHTQSTFQSTMAACDLGIWVEETGLNPSRQHKHRKQDRRLKPSIADDPGSISCGNVVTCLASIAVAAMVLGYMGSHKLKLSKKCMFVNKALGYTRLESNVLKHLLAHIEFKYP